MTLGYPAGCSPCPIVIDTDMGVDDSVAIMIADVHPNVDIKVPSTSFL
jgi:inosine-uridine nucleoside N-ribohydrolase